MFDAFSEDGTDECHKRRLRRWVICFANDYLLFLNPVLCSQLFGWCSKSQVGNGVMFFGWILLRFAEACPFGAYGLLLPLICSPSSRPWSVDGLNDCFCGLGKERLLFWCCFASWSASDAAHQIQVQACFIDAQRRFARSCSLVELCWFQVNGLWVHLVLIETCEQDHKLHWRRSMSMPIDPAMVCLSKKDFQ